MNYLPQHTPFAWRDIPVWKEEPQYDPAVHLHLMEPPHVYTLDFQQKPHVESDELALSGVLSVLSKEGVRVVNEIIRRNMAYTRGSERSPTYLRGLGYTSQFIRDMNECPRLAEFVSRLAGVKLIPHAMLANYSHVNIGKVGVSKNVDSWHVDSVPFVLVTVLSDQSGCEGGALQMVKKNGLDQARQVIADAKGHPDPKDVITVPYLGPGSGLFMQGCKIMHRVTPVLNATEPRISMVFSWMPADCFANDMTSFDYYKKEPEGMFEFTRLKAWRVMKQLQSFVNDTDYTEDPVALATRLQSCCSELKSVADLITGKSKDGVGYFDETTQTMKLNSK